MAKDLVSFQLVKFLESRGVENIFGLCGHTVIDLYNEHCFTGGGFIAPMALAAVPQEKQPSACVGCRGCETVCPQRIAISAAMADFTARLSA